jgi:hypothetical protein
MTKQTGVTRAHNSVSGPLPVVRHETRTYPARQARVHGAQAKGL